MRIHIRYLEFQISSFAEENDTPFRYKLFSRVRYASTSSSSVQADQTYGIIIANKRGNELHFYDPPHNFRKLAA